MRKDMSKVIVERPRTGGSYRRKGRTEVVRDDDGAPLRVRVASKPRRTKSLNENLAPLRRFLESNAGRPWNKVRSEISAHLKPTSTVQQHVIDHLGDLVALDAELIDGELSVRRRFGRAVPLATSGYRLYVHPKTGLLLKNAAWRSWSTKRGETKADIALRRRDLGPLRQAHLLSDGHWYDVVLEADPTRRETVRDARNLVTTRKIPLAFDDAIRDAGLSTLPPQQLYGRTGVHAVSLRRLTKAQRKTLDLP
jgi:hypothetical protein